MIIHPNEEHQQILNDILSRPDFQPRGQGQGFFQQIKRYFKDTLNDILSELSELFDKTKLGDDSFLPRFLRDLTELLYPIVKFISDFSSLFLWICLLGLAIYLAVKFLSEPLRRFLTKERARPASDPRLKKLRFNLEILASLSTDLGGLRKLREMLRAEAREIKDLSPALTDRQLSHQVKAAQYPLSLFPKLSSLYEKAEYEGKPLEQKHVQQLYQSFREQHSS